MTTFDILAILGALAWLPQLIKWIKSWLQKPNLRIFGDEEGQIGFVSFGSVFNISLSFLSCHKYALIENIELTMNDRNNANYNLSWMWYGETYYELKAPLASATMGKQQKAITFLAYKDILTEKLIGFQSKDFLAQNKSLINELNQYIEDQKYAGAEINADNIKRTEQYIKLMKLHDDSFIWKKGEYTAQISVHVFKIKSPFIYKFKFHLSETDINNMRKNIELAKLLIEKRYFPDENKIDDQWQWATPMIKKED